ncbi:hypothetical protein BHE74_00057876 [Ensete ventricosum]|nr:hypothetical protein GW17_00020875 [Ensete ventricosum]RWW37050.1 hypothetical protein BHE74_00057876 [Ensete ventricosum]
MPPQDQTLVKDVDLEMMSMNLKEGDRYVVNHDEDLTVVDLGDDVNLDEKEATLLSTVVKTKASHGAGMEAIVGYRWGKQTVIEAIV